MFLHIQCLINNEQLFIITKQGNIVRINSEDITPSSRKTSGIKGIGLNPEDEVVTALPLRDSEVELALFTSIGTGKRILLKDIPLQKRATKGSRYIKDCEVVAASLVNDKDNISTNVIVDNKEGKRNGEIVGKIEVLINNKVKGYRYLYLRKVSVQDNKSIFSRLYELIKGWKND